MLGGKSLKDYQSVITLRLRDLEGKLAKGDPVKLREAMEISDKLLIRKWLWIVSIVGGPACFIGLPFLLAALQLFMPRIIMQGLWILAKGAMGIVFITFITAIIITTRKNEEDAL